MPPEAHADPALHEILGALILGADHAITVREIRRILEAVAQDHRAEAGEGPAVSDEELLAAAEAGASPASETDDAGPEEDTVSGATGIDGRAIKEAFARLRDLVRGAGLGMDLVEVSGGYRLQTSAACGPWVRRMLNRGKPQRISRPMIETLAIIAYRQPISRSEIESIRGVSVGHVVKALMEMQLVRILGRSDLPGRPFLFGTTATFLDHFGLKSLNELNAIQPGVERTPPAEQRAKHLRKPARAAEPAADTADTAAAAPATLADAGITAEGRGAAAPETVVKDTARDESADAAQGVDLPLVLSADVPVAAGSCSVGEGA